MARKKHQGPIKDKDRSMQKLVEAVGTVITTSGYTGLTPTNIAKAAGLDRKLISLYFGSVENLVETYIKGKDYWVAASADAPALAENDRGNNTREMLEQLLHAQLDYFNQNQEMQKIVLWQISEHTEIMKRVCEQRETLSTAFFSLSDKELAGKDVDLRGIAALLVAGVYYLVLHAKTEHSTFCEIDLSQPEGLERIKNAIKMILKNAYDSNEVKS